MGDALAHMDGVPEALSGLEQANLSIEAYFEPFDLQLGLEGFSFAFQARQSRI
jgi:hypothetical protein